MNNSLAEVHPELVSEWSEKNKIKPIEVSIGSHKKVIWRCKKGHEWEAAVKSRTINKTDVTFMLDEFANVALPDDFCSLLSTMRSREISSIIIIQNFAQLKALFKDTWETILGNCDTFIYLGGNEQSMHKYVSELLGKGTIDKKSSGETKGRQGSSSRNYDVLGRELFTPDEVRKLDNKKCIIFICGFDPIMDNKFIPFNHPMFNQTADGKGEPYVHQIRGADNLIGPPFEILSDKAVKYYEKLRDKGENVYIDSLTYEQFMMLGDAELVWHFSIHF